MDALLERLVRALGPDGTEAEMLLAHASGRSRAWLRAHDDAVLPQETATRALALAARRATGEPFAYIVGSAGFYRRDFAVDARVLVPRPETEHLIDDALRHLRGNAVPRIADLGTGSGAIAVTLAAELPQALVDAVDISAEALALARENAARHGVSERVAFHLGDLLAPLRTRRYDAILANLPYVPTGEIARAPDPVSFEPRLALDGGPDGLDLYRRLLVEAPAALAPGGALYLEAAPPLMAGLRALVEAAFPAASIALERDYGGRERYVRVVPR
ncbi:MAG: peptide chain release factor N(5)-glutamine methyltransferase [bacterium]|nr:peptide chain release factor N(5)-glutamine methyltransferase [bacterium]